MSAARDNLICDAYESGSTLQECGDRFSLTRERVRQILKKHGVSERHRMGAKRRESVLRSMAETEAKHQRRENFKARKTEALRLYADGLSCKEVAARTGISSTSIAAYARDAGASQRRSFKPRLRLKPHYGEIASRFFGGETAAALGAAFDCHPGIIGDIARRVYPGRLKISQNSDQSHCNFMSPTWAEESERKLTEMWMTHSAAQIAAALGISRNAVIGKAYRLSLPAKKMVWVVAA